MLKEYTMTPNRIRYLKYAKYMDLYNIAASILALPLVIIVFFNLKRADYSYAGSIGKNWESYPILEIRGISAEESCLKDENILDFGQWEGTFKGCDCSKVTYTIGTSITRGFCSRRQSECSSIQPIDAMPFRNWRGKKLCVKRYLQNYMKMNLAEKPEYCPINYKSCGIIDSKNNYLCISEIESCPINKMSIFTFDELDRNIINSHNINFKPNDNAKYNLNNNKLLKNYQGFIFLNGGVLAYSNNFVDSKIIIEFKISEGQPCFLPYFKNVREVKFILEKDYYLTRCYASKKTNELNFDRRYEKIDSYPKYEIYNDNKIYDSIKKNILRDNNFSNYDIQENFGNKFTTYPNRLNQIKNPSYLNEKEQNRHLLDIKTEGNSTVNDFQNFYINSVYSYDFNYKYNVDLYVRNYIGMNLSCINDFNEKNIQDKIFYHTSQLSRDLFLASDVAYYVVLAQTALFVYCCTVYGIFYFLKFSSDDADITLYYDRFKYKILWAIFPLIITSILNAGSGFILTRSSQYNEPKNFWANSNCVDQDTSDYYSDLHSRFSLCWGLCFIVGRLNGFHLLFIWLFYGLGLCGVFKEK